MSGVVFGCVVLNVFLMCVSNNYLLNRLPIWLKPMLLKKIKLKQWCRNLAMNTTQSSKFHKYFILIGTFGVGFPPQSKALFLRSPRIHVIFFPPFSYMKKPLGPPPPSYTCFRCGKPGHYIKNCPTNGVSSKQKLCLTFFLLELFLSYLIFLG